MISTAPREELEGRTVAGGGREKQSPACMFLIGLRGSNCTPVA